MKSATMRPPCTPDCRVGANPGACTAEGQRRLLAWFCAGLLLAAPAAADDAPAVSRLMEAGRYAEAMAAADAGLERQPGDARLRFAKGILLARQGQSGPAIAMLEKLTADFPGLPEPYNNLAALYAAQGDFRQAQLALEKAVQLKPDYLIAYENLGDVLAELASQAYEKANALDGSNARTRERLAALRGGTAGTGAPQAQAAGTAILPGTLPQAAVQPVAHATDVGNAGPAGATASEHEQILATLAGWAQAWSARDMRRYLSFYSDNFEPPDGQSRAAWIASRTARIQGKRHISVVTRAPRVQVEGDTATISFLQMYTSDSVNANDRKTLELVRHGDGWQIRRERVEG